MEPMEHYTALICSQCMAVEYLYWGVAAWTGALVGRGQEIKREWKFETRAKLEAGDLKMTAIIKVIFCF